MITRRFERERIEFTHTPPPIVRGLGALSMLVNGGMLAAGVLLVRGGQLFGVALAMLGGLGVAFGLGMVFGRHTQSFGKETIIRTWSLLLTLRTRTLRVAEIEALVLTRTYRRVKHSVVLLEQLSAVGPGAQRTELLSSGDPAFLTDVETLSLFLGKALRDERVRDTRKMVRDTQIRALPVALAAALVLVCVAGAAALTIALSLSGPTGDHADTPVFEPESSFGTEGTTMSGRGANRSGRRSVSHPRHDGDHDDRR